MNSEEAKLILQASHSGDADPTDPQIAEALAQTQRDPELLAWFKQQRALDEAIAIKLQEVCPPAGLAEKILMGRKARIPPKRNRFWMPLALAASILGLLSLTIFLVEKTKPKDTEFAALQSEMTGFLTVFPKLDLATDQWPQILNWLNKQPALAGAQIPASLQRFPGLGCREVKWRDKTLMLVCFAAQGEVVHLFVLPKADLPDAPFNDIPTVARIQNWSTASWTRGEISYLALTKANTAFLQALLSEQPRG